MIEDERTERALRQADAVSGNLYPDDGPGQDDDPSRRSMNYTVQLTVADLESHAAEMEEQPWWPLHLAEGLLPPCPTCSERLELLLSGEGWCDRCRTRWSSAEATLDGRW